MATGYTAPLRDMRFVLDEMIGIEGLAALDGLDQLSPDLVTQVLDEAGRFAAEVIGKDLPIDLDIVADFIAVPVARNALPAELLAERDKKGILFLPRQFQEGAIDVENDGGMGRLAHWFIFIHIWVIRNFYPINWSAFVSSIGSGNGFPCLENIGIKCRH